MTAMQDVRMIPGELPFLLAYVCLGAWTALAINMQAILDPLAKGADFGLTLLLAWMSGRFACAALVSLLGGRTFLRFDRAVLQGASLAFVELGTVMLACAANGWLGSPALTWVGAGVAGAGIELANLLWLELLSRGSFSSARVVIIADAGFKALVSTMVFVPLGIALAACLVLPVLGALCYVRVLRSRGRSEETVVAADGAQYRLSWRTAVPVGVGVALLYFGSHVMQGFPVEPALGSMPAGLELWSVVVGRWVALFVLVLLLTWADEMRFEVLFSGAALVAIGGFLGILSDAMPQGYAVFCALTMAACVVAGKAFDLVMVSVSGHANVPALRVLALGEAVVSASHLLSIVAAMVLADVLTGADAAGTLHIVCVACVALLAVSGMWLLRDRVINAFLWERVGAEAGEDTGVDGCRSVAESGSRAVERLAQEHGLSGRETEVAALLLAGRSIPYVADELSVSESTAKTYVGRIYRKCDVHSRQDFITLAHCG